MDRQHASLPRRVILAFIAVQLLFKFLVGYSYLDLAGVQTAADRNAALRSYTTVSLVFSLAFFASLVVVLGPIRRWQRALATGTVSDDVLARAGHALYRLPSRSAWLWSSEWTSILLVLIATRDVTCREAAVLFLAALLTGPRLIASTITFWLAAPSLRQISIRALERGITLDTPVLRLRQRLAWFGMLIAFAPSSYLASFAFSARVMNIPVHAMIAPIAICCTAVVAFAAISASLMAASVTDSVASMAEVIRTIAHQGDVTRVARIPQQVRDEIGGLAASTNEMIDRLERTAEERAAMSQSLETLNHALECRVAERTARLFEANEVLEHEMATRAKIEIELRHAQKLEAVGRLASGIAHEINTPIQFVGDSIQFVTDATSDLMALIDKYRGVVRTVLAGDPALPAARDAEAAEQIADLAYTCRELPAALQRAHLGLGRVGAIVRSMKNFAHPNQGMCEVDLNEAIRSTLTIAYHEYKFVADIETELAELPLVYCYAGEINQVVLNLLVNAAHAIAEVHPDGASKGTITIRTFSDGSTVVIEIADTGSGISEAIRDRIFDPFFTTKEVSRGTGQGLAISRSVITEKHGGSLTFTTEVGKGTTFTIRLPIAGARTQPLAVTQPTPQDRATMEDTAWGGAVST